MDTQAILEKMEELLEEERMAIRSLRGTRVHGIACEKHELMQKLEATRDVRRPEHVRRVKQIVARLRHNSVLLVQAKTILAEAIRLKKAKLASPTLGLPRPESHAADKRLSVVG